MSGITKFYSFRILFYFSILIFFQKLVHSKTENNSFFKVIDDIYSKNLVPGSKEELQEKLFTIFNHPIDLNLASKEDLQQLYILTDKRIKNFFEHIYQSGYLLSIYELQTIKSFNAETIKLLKPFVRVDLKNIPKKISLKNLQYSYILFRLKYPFNESNTKYTGSLDYEILKAKIYDPGLYRLGFAAKKAKGEAFTFDNFNYGFNHYSISFELDNFFYLHKIILGDFQLGCGQGIITSSGYSFKKVTDYAIIIKDNQNLQSKQSFNKNSLYRGLGALYSANNMDLIVLYSMLYLDGILKGDFLQKYAESISKNLDYNTENNLFKKNQLLEQIIGISAQLHTERNRSNIGSTILLQSFDPILLRTRKRKDFDYLLRGDKNFNISIFGKHTIMSTTLFFEKSYSNHNINYKKHRYKDRIGLLVGSMTALNKYLDFSICARHYGTNFHSIRGNSLRERSSENKNEQGVYLGIKITPYYNLVIQNYIDFFFFPAPTYTISRPSRGYEYCTKVELHFNRNHLFTIKLSHKKKDKEKLNKVIKQKEMLKESTIRTKFKYQYNLNENVSFKTHFHSSHNKLKLLKNSFLFAEDIEYKYGKYAIKGRLAFFTAGSDVNNTLFVYESNLLYDNPRPVGYRNKGQKVVLYLCYKPFAPLRLELKYTLTNECKNYNYELKNCIGVQLMYRI